MSVLYHLISLNRCVWVVVGLVASVECCEYLTFSRVSVFHLSLVVVRMALLG